MKQIVLYGSITDRLCNEVIKKKVGNVYVYCQCTRKKNRKTNKDSEFCKSHFASIHPYKLITNYISAIPKLINEETDDEEIVPCIITQTITKNIFIDVISGKVFGHKNEDAPVLIGQLVKNMPNQFVDLVTLDVYNITESGVKIGIKVH